MKKVLRNLVFCTIMALLTVGCDVHELPDTSGNMPVLLHLKYSVAMPVIHKPVVMQRSANVFTPVYDSGAEVMYDVKAYRHGDTNAPVARFMFTRSADEGLDCDHEIQLPNGEYDIYVWSYLVGRGGQSFYDANSFDAITIAGKHCGGTELRDAHRGIEPLQVVNHGIAGEQIEATIDMERPLARYEFISTDFATFLEKEQSRLNKLFLAAGGDSRTENKAPARVQLDDYKVQFYYVGFMPNEYSMFADRPVDSLTGVAFPTTVKARSATEASVGFDYVFVNHAPTAVTVRIALTYKDGTQISLTDPVEVPLQRSYATEVRGAFLTATAQSGININTQFDGNYNIIY